MDLQLYLKVISYSVERTRKVFITKHDYWWLSGAEAPGIVLDQPEHLSS